MVSSELDAYKNAYMYVLAIILDVDIPSLNLSDRAAEAAFGLAEVLGGRTRQWFITPLH